MKQNELFLKSLTMMACQMPLL